MLLTALLILLPFYSQAETRYQTSEQFIQQALGMMPTALVLWLDKPQQHQVEQILAHTGSRHRYRCWRSGKQSVWVLDEVGKEAPITVGIHIANGKIVTTRVLVYRESRGDEVRHEFFTDQFKTAALTEELQLDRHIDGITGATLSVRALTKLSRIALYLDSLVQTGDPQ
ncbi:FMN-binding protein [Shewanella sp. GXUN23E]|uniref:FMN-binding protein n=1 Tax=Shewanella sp. GXUN23E TaxID=3422498 RepID=UPI003D7D523A